MLDLGLLGVGEAGSGTVKVRNAGDRTVKILTTKASCACTYAKDISGTVLAPGEAVDLSATLEPKPGVPASGAHLARLLEQLTPNPPAAIIRAPFENEKPAEWLSSRLDVPIILMPYTVGGNDDSADLISLYDASIALLEDQL